MRREETALRAYTRNKLECEWVPHIIRFFGLDSHSKKSDVEKKGSDGTEGSTSGERSIAIYASLVIRDSDSLQVIESHAENAVIKESLSLHGPRP